MTYQHKHESCAKKTKDILAENFLKVKKAEYDLAEPSDSIDADDSIGKVMKNEDLSNIFLQTFCCYAIMTGSLSKVLVKKLKRIKEYA